MAHLNRLMIILLQHVSPLIIIIRDFLPSFILKEFKNERFELHLVYFFKTRLECMLKLISYTVSESFRYL